MANLFGWNFDIPGITKGDVVKAASTVNPLAGAAVAGGLAIADPTIDLIPGVGLNEASRNKSSSNGGGSGNTTSTGGNQGSSAPSGGSSSAGYSAPARDLAAEGFYQAGIDQTQSLINTLGPREQAAVQALIDSFVQQQQRAQVAYGDNESDYNKSTDRLIRENAQKKETIDRSVRTNTNALQRLLGSRGAGSSSASQLVVPYAVASEGTAQRADASQQYSDNKDTLDTNWDRYKREWQQSQADAEADKTNKQRDIQAQFAQTGIDARQKMQELQANLAAARGGDATAINKAKSLSGEINALQQKIADLATRASSQTVTSKDVGPVDTTTKAITTDSTSTAQRSNDPTYDETQSYYGDVQAAKDPSQLSDEELLKQLLATQ